MPHLDSIRSTSRWQPLLVATLLATLAPACSLLAQRTPAGRGCEAPARSCVRPFITDDARVVGAYLGQLESWYRGDEESHQAWLLVAYGPTSRTELTIGGVTGQDRTDGSLTYALPLVQGKLLLREYATGAPPGFALALGTFLPGGNGLLRPPGYGAFGFATVTQALGDAERVLLHVNAGANHLWVSESGGTVATWGVGTQVRTVGGLHAVAEVFSGDPYVPGSGTSWQGGVRHFVSDRLQVDATLGEGFRGRVQLPRWWSVGVRWVVGPFGDR